MLLHSPPPPSEKSTPDGQGNWALAGLAFVVVCLFSGLALQSILENPRLAESFVSLPTWRYLMVGILSAELWTETGPQGETLSEGAIVATAPCLLLVLVPLLLFSGGVYARARWRNIDFTPRHLLRLSGWWGLLGLWGVLWLLALLLQFLALATFLQASVAFWVSLVLAGSCYELGRDAGGAEVDSSPAVALPWPVLLAMGVYVLVFTAMNWGLWFNLRLPHGDTAMYEEHLWNVLHGKGFRSYLDQGLFWGEHIQFVHLFLIPVYLLWPSHLLLELCESLVIAVGALPVFWLARRASGSARAGYWLSFAYLLYFPLQFLDIAIDLKTFRPIAFGMAPVLFALDQLDRGRYKTATGLLLFSLTCKEDYSIVIFSVGLVLVAEALVARLRFPALPSVAGGALRWKFGLGYMIAGPVYLLLALRIIRWFRTGTEVHYAGYFSKFGNTTGEIIWTMLTNPALLLGELATINTAIYALAVLLPIGFLPLLAPLRLLGCLPMFVLLCLNELARDPRHHFHAPLIPLLFWAAASGLSRFALRSSDGQVVREELPGGRRGFDFQPVPSRLACWAVCCGVSTSLWFSLSPLGVAFWDAGSAWHWRALYWPGERARQFARIADLIPVTARVASTDYVHPRYTHHERSYDYSQYARRVSGYALQVPADTDYIVIDTRHPYSSVRGLGDVRELQAEPEAWEVLPDRTSGYFLVLKRRASARAD